MSTLSRRTLLLSTGATLLLAKTGAFAQGRAGWTPPPIPPHDPKVDTEWRH